MSFYTEKYVVEREDYIKMEMKYNNLLQRIEVLLLEINKRYYVMTQMKYQTENVMNLEILDLILIDQLNQLKKCFLLILSILVENGHVKNDMRELIISIINLKFRNNEKQIELLNTLKKLWKKMELSLLVNKNISLFLFKLYTN